ncbi:hypothetical protein ACQPYK_03155 [Streptosporangium sp. CA-135522]|uniref:hypothetical protein n=1 Tax=Streptosporangium sp. CA-135522 TaxID=3240072 RepID=UPI003D930B0D
MPHIDLDVKMLDVDRLRPYPAGMPLPAGVEGFTPWPARPCGRARTAVRRLPPVAPDRGREATAGQDEIERIVNATRFAGRVD